MQNLKVFYASLLLLLSFTSVYAQIPLTDSAKVTVLTCGPGEELYSVFGHTAIRVYDPEINIDTVYNFGTFDFSTSNFYLKFIKGNLKYFVSVSSYKDFIYEYLYYGRSVYEQELNLTIAQKQSIYNELNDVLFSERRFYTYKFIDRNCTTMVADIIEANINGKISDETSDKGKTNREIIYSYLDNLFFENLGINLIFGYKTDKVSDKVFLPKELMEGINNTTINGKELALPPVTVCKEKEKTNKFSIWNNYYTFSLVMLLLVFFSRNKTILNSFLAISGLLGIFFCIVGLYSFHSEITQNYNALMINPIFLILLFFILTKKNKAVYITSCICFAILMLYIIYMLNKPHLIIVLPIVIATAVILLRIIFKYKCYAKTDNV